MGVHDFAPRLLEVTGGSPSVLSPVMFRGRIDELTLERWIVDRPELLGEPLLVLGHQLAEFEEDQDRLDVLAVDESGELVLIELKVTENFRVTDLQALAYAGAYAKRLPHDLAETLRRTHARRTDSTPGPPSGKTETVGSADETGTPRGTHRASVSLEGVKSEIATFLGLEDFDDWEPSQHVRIKLLAPSFPRRVLKTVKWLGDVYDMPIEAIAVRLFEDAEHRFSLSFERVLPLPGEEDFDLTVRRREDRRRTENVTRRRQPAILPLLLEHGVIGDGQTLWLGKNVLPVAARDAFDPDNPAYQVRLTAEDDAPPRFEWTPSLEAPVESLPPSDVVYRIWTDVCGMDRKPFKTGVAGRFTIEPDGKTLEDIALDRGLWSPIEDAPGE